MNPIICLHKIAKMYQLHQPKAARSTLAESITGLGRSAWRGVRGVGSWLRSGGLGRANAPKRNDFWALKDISFEVQQGEVVGIIGRNGAGKSTLLKILSRITEPTAGRAELNGRVGSLLEVGTGFHAELTGRENVYLNGAILGMSRREVARKFDAIVAFAGVENFIDTPVKHYSSGMHVRLGFSVAAHLEPEILILDEVLAVGDAGFQKKCLGKLSQFTRSGRTILLVSHNMATVQNLCNKALLLDQGRIAASGDCSSVLRTYLQANAATSDNLLPLASYRAPGCMPVIQAVTLLDNEGEPTSRICSNSELTIEIHYDSPVPLENPVFGVIAETLVGERLFHLQSTSQHALLERISRQGVIRCRVPTLPLQPGSYYLSFNCSTLHTPGDLDWLPRAMAIDVEAADVFGTGRLPPTQNGPFLVRANWSFPTALTKEASAVGTPEAVWTPQP